MNRKILKAGHLAKLTGYHVKHICRLARQGGIDGNRANPGGKQIWWIDDKKIRRWVRQNLKGDRSDAPVPNPLTFINHLARWHRRVKIGLIQPPPLEILRNEFERPVFLMIEHMGTEYFLEKLVEVYGGDEIFEKWKKTTQRKPREPHLPVA